MVRPPAERFEPACHRLRALGERHAAHRVDRKRRRRDGMQREQGLCEARGPSCSVRARGGEAAQSIEPRHDGPRPRVAEAGATRDDRRGNSDAGRGEPGGDPGQHLLLVQHEWRGECATGESDGEPVAQPPHRAVPPVGGMSQRQRCGIRNARGLARDQRAHKRLTDLELCRRFVGHNSTLAPAARTRRSRPHDRRGLRTCCFVL